MSAAFATAAHAALARAGAAFFDAYEGSLVVGAAAPVACKVFIDRATEAVGEFGESVVGQIFITFVADGVAPVPGATLTANGVAYQLERKLDADGSTERWSARRV